MGDDAPQAVRALARLARVLECALEDLSLPQYRVLAAVDDGGERATSLAAGLALAKPTVTAAVDGLVERGYLARQPVPRDRRGVRIALTPAGYQALRDAEATMADALARVVEGTGNADSIRTALTTLGAALDRSRGVARR